MDTRSKSSHKIGIITAVLILALCSVIMMGQYGSMASYLNTEEAEATWNTDALWGMGYDLNEGNYILYNEYAKETDPSEVLEEYGQRRFDLTKKYLDYGVFNSEGESVLDDTSNTVSDRLQAEDTEDYAFRVTYWFSQSGELSGIQVDGTEMSPQEAYNLEVQYLNEFANSQEDYGIASIATISDVSIVYGMTEDNLISYCSAFSSDDIGVYDLAYSPAFADTLKVLCLIIVVAALLLPCVKRLDISEMKMFQVPFEIPVIVLLCLFATEVIIIPAEMAYMTINGTFLQSSGYILETGITLINFAVWFIFFGILFWAVTSMRVMVRMKGAYWKERTLTVRMIRRIRNRGDEDDVKMKERAGGIIRKIRDFFARQYDALQHLDFQDKTNRTILKVVVINFIILFIVCLFWWYGTFALIIYSVLLFFFLRKYMTDIQEKYKLLLKSTNQLAEGHLDVPIDGDIGLFNPIQDELKKIQKGFKKAVEEEVKNERMKTELVTNVSHDLRTPLTAIITYTDLLKNEKDEEKRKEYIQVLERKSLRLKVLIEDLFEISKAASKSVVMHFMKVDIIDLLKQVELENDSKIKEMNLEFKWRLPEHKLVMYLDSQKTYRIFENLIVNITKYALPHTRVYIEVTEKESSVHISMKNVSATELDFNTDEITDRFVRGDSSRNTEGSGLGLAIAKSFVELQHGTLKISTEADLFKADIMLPKLEIPAGGGESGTEILS
ncbi:sensor histidine kinase [Clostridium sp. Marseille-P3244]|uniref:sensor histidine kinase n=1 Tax=Clostridium sp. Marseille-P3244 TaxID=1871020 RepID=UPI0009301FD0